MINVVSLRSIKRREHVGSTCFLHMDRVSQQMLRRFVLGKLHILLLPILVRRQLSTEYVSIATPLGIRRHGSDILISKVAESVSKLLAREDHLLVSNMV